MACYFKGAQNGSNCYELYNKENLEGDIEVIKDGADEIVNHLGQHVNYYVNTYSVSAANNLYGEHPTSVFATPVDIKMYIQLTENALRLTVFGYDPGDSIIGYVTIRTFTNTFSGLGIYEALVQDIEPKAGDVFQMVEYGSDRPNGRAGNFFEVTERIDQDIATMNPLGGHYFWCIKAKRLDYSFQPGIPGESRNDQVYDDVFSGKVDSTIVGETSSAPKSYPQNINEDSANIFDQTQNNTGVYGGYSNS